MMDQSEFNQRVNASGSGIEPYVCERLLRSVTQRFEKDTRRFWQYRTKQMQQWNPEFTDQYLWFLGVPVLNTSNFNLMEYDLADKISSAVPVHSHAYTINWTEGEIFKVRNSRWLQTVICTYDCGLTPAQIPDYVKDGLVMQARYMITRFTGNKLDIRSQSVKGSSAQLLTTATHPIYDEAVRQGRRIIHGNTGSVAAFAGPEPNYSLYNDANGSGFDFTGFDPTTGQGFQ